MFVTNSEGKLFHESIVMFASRNTMCRNFAFTIASKEICQEVYPSLLYVCVVCVCVCVWVWVGGWVDVCVCSVVDLCEGEFGV